MGHTSGNNIILTICKNNINQSRRCDSKCGLDYLLVRGTLGFSVLRFWLFFRSVFRFWCSLRFADFSFFSIWFSVFVENTSGFSVLLSNVLFGFSYFILFGFRFLLDLSGN